MIEQTDYTRYDYTGTTNTISGYYDNTSSTSWTITYSNYRIDKSFINKLLRLEHLKMIRSGWNNPPVIGDVSSPILPNIKTVIRNRLPIKIRFD